MFPVSSAEIFARVASIFAGSHVDVGITMHILSISSLSEVQMVLTFLLGVHEHLHL